MPHPLPTSGGEIVRVCDLPLLQLWVITEELFGSSCLARCLTSLNMSQYSVVIGHLVTEGNLYLYSNKKKLFDLHVVEAQQLQYYIKFSRMMYNLFCYNRSDDDPLLITHVLLEDGSLIEKKLVG
jgi:hypothetical protein